MIVLCRAPSTTAGVVALRALAAFSGDRGRVQPSDPTSVTTSPATRTVTGTRLIAGEPTKLATKVFTG